MPRLLLERLRVRDLRNIEQVDFEPAPRVTVISGDNGHGKTSLLEAIYFAATSRSFRTHRPGELVRHGAKVAFAGARFVEVEADLPPIAREQTVAVEVANRGRAEAGSGVSCAVRIDGNRPPSLAEFATRSPVIAFHPEELTLSTGPAPGRRTLLDRLALFMDPLSADHRARYTRAMKARQQLLRKSAGSSLDSPDIIAFEDLAARHGAALTEARALATAALNRELIPAFEQIAAPTLSLEARFAPGGSADRAEAAAELKKNRARDAFRTSSSFGPHRDDLTLLLNGHPARIVGSQGQHRALTLALKAAETAAIAKARGLEPILLLDDVSSELDRERTLALFSFLSRRRGQILLTTTRRELIVTPDLPASERRDFHVESGVLLAVQ